MVTRRTKPKASAHRDRDKPGGKLEAFAKRVGGYGYSITPHALFRLRKKLGLEKADLLVLLAILSHAGDRHTDFACASFEVLAGDTGLNRKTVITHVTRLRKELKLLTWTNQRKPDKSLTPNVYDVRPLAEKLKELATTVLTDEPDDEVDLDAIIAELMAEPGDVDLDDLGGVEVPASPPRRRPGRWATVEKDSDDDEPKGERAATAPRARATTASTTPQSPSPPPERDTAPGSPWASGSRLRPLELDEPDRAQLDRSERLRHPDGRELTVHEHLRRMREMECYSRGEVTNLLMDLGYPDEQVNAAVNANAVEHLARLAGARQPDQVPEPEPDEPPALPMPPGTADDPIALAAWEAIERIRLRRLREQRSKRGKS